MAVTPSFNNNLFASVDMGTNSFKLLIVRTDSSTGRFIALDRLKEPVVLGRDIVSSSKISAASYVHSFDALTKFQEILCSNRVPPAHTSFVATSAIREALNRSEFTTKVHQTLGLEVNVLSGEEEARLSYIGVLQFHPVFDKKVLTIDIGGGSTEFVIGKQGKVIVGISLKLGHVTLTEEFVKTGELQSMREHIRSVIRKSGLIDKVAEQRFDIVIGSSGTVRSIEKAIFYGYGGSLMDDAGLFEGHKRDWRFVKEELGDLVSRLYLEEGRIELLDKRDKFFKRRSEFIVAGAVLLEEIFVALGIFEMVVSGYSLGEGVIAEKMYGVLNEFDLNANARWHSVVRLAKRFNNKKRMKSAALCSSIAKELFESLRKLMVVYCEDMHIILDDKDREYLEAACLLHNIGLFLGEKGYHKQSYKIIMNGEHLHGYNSDEVKYSDNSLACQTS
ncbi:guanosine-5'-triphosphate,3'-diphosphate pyrophosphatase isoform X2 [Impatiens glandulifera]|uniref:guanosine-5'-triphosphate,3'-diphosphate pyrophosphatase isoform X2 n=1 Tax=Impatiens glandulifera TaxID=253017 RepID=UPI001FB10B73|nr:guanosine-5'-triphosphate,3'-diphosphate pyrophosphatase isoform X2 [Impatiens glandulifera]